MFFFLNFSCWFHGCLKEGCQDSKKTYNGLSLEELNFNDQVKQNTFRCLMGKNDKLFVTWECEFKLIQKTKDYKDYVARTNFHPRPKQRMNPRTANKGGVCDTLGFIWTAEKYPDENLYFQDQNSAYLYQALTKELPHGNYKVLCPESCTKQLTWNTEHGFMYNNSVAFGFLNCKILPPSDEKNPCLSFTLQKKLSGLNDCLVSPLCRTCAENRQLQPCRHDDEKRAIIGTWTFPEINLALKTQKYILIEFYESHVYEEHGLVMKTFIETAQYLKLSNSGFPDTISTIAQKQSYCDDVNREAKMNGSLLFLTPNEVKHNLFHTKCMKGFALTVLGKLSQNAFEKISFFIYTQKALQNIVDENRLLSISFPCKDVALVTKSLNNPNVPVKTCQSMGSYITSNNRVDMITNLKKLENLGAVNYYLDTDSHVYALSKKVTELPFQNGIAFGRWKHEQKNIQSFYSLGKKRYKLTYLEGSKLITVIKNAGLSQNPYIDSQTNLCHQYESMVEGLIKNMTIKTSVPQKRKMKMNAGSSKRKLYGWNLHSISNNYITRKIILDKNRYISVPYGFNSDVMQ